MSARVSRLAAVATLVGFPVAMAVSFGLARAAGGEAWEQSVEGGAMAVPFAAFALVGALILVRRPGHLVGWLCAGIGALFAVVAVALAYAGWGFASPRPAPGTVLAVWVANWTWYPLLGAAAVALPLLVPDGRLVSRRWRVVAWLGAVAVGGMVALAALHPRLMSFDEGATIANPVGVDGLPSPIESTAADLLLVLLLAATLGAASSVVARYRRASAEDRVRLKWIVFGFTLAVAVGTALDVVQGRLIAAGGAGISNTIWAGVWMLLPASIGIAILRHRLFDIDRIVSRTVAYGLVTVVLVGVYVAGVVGLGALVRGVTGSGGGDLVVAASTLLVAAAFGPLRRRTQAVVDRRFNRSRYDAQRTVEDFVQRLRDEVDLDALATETARVAAGTMHPSSLSLWLRGSESSS